MAENDNTGGPPQESVWRRLTRLFRSGPIVRHKIAGGERMVEPQGTASAFKKELSSLYVRSLASYANYERLSRYSDYNEMEFTPELHVALNIYCLGGETKVLTTNGVHSIQSLFDEGREGFWLYSFDVKKDRFVPGFCKRVMKTGENQPVVRLTLDNGNSVRLTANHLVLLSSGEYRAVSELQPGDHIRSLYRRTSKKVQGDFLEGYEMLLQPNGKWQYSHRVVAEGLLGHEKSPKDVVHHVDINKRNNDPSNLRFMSWEAHQRLHAGMNTERWSDPVFAEKMRTTFSQHALSLHAIPGWTKDVFLKRRDEVFSSYSTQERKEKFGRPGPQNGQFGKGYLHEGERNGRFIQGLVREFSAGQLNSLMQRGVEFTAALVELNTTSECLRREMKRLGLGRWTANVPSPTKTREDPSVILALKQEMLAVSHPSRSFKAICEKLGLGQGFAYRQLILAGYANWGDFISQTNHRVLSVVPDGTCDVFDLEVTGLHNFAVSSTDGDDFIVVHNSDEATCVTDDGDVIAITSPNAEIKDTLETLFYDVLNINFNAWSWMRHFVKFGDFVLFVDANEQNGILNLIPVPINEIEREEGYDPKDPMAVRFRWLTRGNTILENWQIIHFRLLGNDAYLPYGSSVLEPVRRIWRQLILIEDAMLVYRIVRSPERRVFHIELGNTPPDQVDAFMEQVRSQLKRNEVIDPSTGRVDLRYNPLSVSDDYFLPKRGEQMNRIDTLAGGQFVGDIDDVRYIQSKMFTGIIIPRAWLGFEENMGSKCLRGPTKVSLLDGRELPIIDMFEEHRAGKEHWVYTNTPEGRFIPTRVKHVWPNRQVTRLMRVTLDNGEAVECTDNHPFMLRDGTYRRADELNPEDSLMPLYRKLSSKVAGDIIEGYEKLLDNETGKWEFTHHAVDREAGLTHLITKSRVIHHVDCDKRNNQPANLQEMTWLSHRQWHQRNAALTLHTPEARAKAAPALAAWRSSERAKQMWREIGRRTAAPGTPFHERQTSPKFAEERSERARKRWRDPEYRATKTLQNREIWDRPEVRAKLSGENHWSVRRYEGYDIEWLVAFCIEHGITEKRFFCIARNGTPIGQGKLMDIIEKAGYRGWRDFAKDRLPKFARNHRVLSVEVIELREPEWVYDLEVESEHHNFALTAGVYTHNSSLAQLDVRFAKTTERIQRLFVQELNKVAILHLYLLGYRGPNLVNFVIEMGAPSTVAAQQRLELWRMKLEVAGMAQEGVFNRDFVRRRIFDLNDKQIASIKDGIRTDKLEDMLNQSIEAPSSDTPDASGGPPPATPEAPAPGADELPDTLGGTPGGDQPAAPETQTASRARQGTVMSETSEGRFHYQKRNRGSEGDRAEISVDKGRSLFSTGEDPLALTFGTEKQTASDPYDLRAKHRLISRPFSEGEDLDAMPGAVAVEEVEEMLEAIAREFGLRIPSED